MEAVAAELTGGWAREVATAPVTAVATAPVTAVVTATVTAVARERQTVATKADVLEAACPVGGLAGKVIRATVVAKKVEKTVATKAVLRAVAEVA